ncbi:MAG: peptide ABC transporter substrate-binding protein [Chlamydiales bacterium]|nr:peptide ABC transporter substrate-binding protein [Chlamydiales bacterium]
MTRQMNTTPPLAALSEEKTPHCFRWRIQPQFGSHQNSPAIASYVRVFEELIDELMPKGACFEDEKELLAWIQESIPLVKWETPEAPPGIFSLVVFCQAAKLYKTETLLLQYLQNRLVPHKEISILSAQHLYFHFTRLPNENFLVLQVRVLIEDSMQLNHLANNASLLAKELKLALTAAHFARDFLEVKTLSEDFKTTLIFEDLTRLQKKFPHLFDRALFVELRKMLALSTKEFLESRSSRHLAKILSAHNVMRKIITRTAALFPQERHLQLRLSQTRLQFLFGTKSVVGLMIGIYLLDKYEFFEEKHILLAVQKIIPDAQSVKGSFYDCHSPHDMIRTLYLEIEKRDGEPITLQERGLLKRQLPHELKGSVEKVIPAVFMMRNEEEIMKNILILSQELKYFSDLPQVMINLEQQSGSDLIFTVVLVRLLGKDIESLERLFDDAKIGVEVTVDRVQIVGYLRKKYPKEASTFRLRIPKEPSILRADSSVNFYLARLKVMHILNQTVGEVRDYNGGMILQQVEQFSQLKQAFPETSLRHPDLLEDFFYALTPIEVQATLPLEQLHALFRLLLESIGEELPKRESYVLKVQQKEENLFLLIRAREPSYREQIQRSLSALELFPKSLSSTHVDIQGSYCSGFIYDCTDIEQQRKFLETFQQTMRTWQEKICSEQILRLSYLYFPLSLDPRIGGDEDSERLLELMFEGLMRMGGDGKPSCALAKTYEVSADGRHYTFKLRETFWTNGDPVTAYDFEYAWKKVLTPDFSTPFVYLFYPIKNAKNAKEGRVPLSEVGVKVVDERTIVVELEHPAPYFLELTAFTIYAPVNRQIDRIHPNWADQEGAGYVCNGPFRLKRRSATRGYELIKNQLYWDAKRVSIEQVLVTQNDNYTSLQMFKNDEIDWLGRPLRTWSSSFESGCPEEVECCSTPRIFWYVFNVKRFPFNHTKIRRAFAYALDRKSIIEELRHLGSKPAVTPLPLAHTQLLDQGIADGDKARATALFEEALHELGLKKEEFPVITLIRTKGGVSEKSADLVAEQWKQLFGIRCRVESYEWNTIFNRMTQGDFQIGGMGWKSWINDPIYTLNAFRYASEKVNFAKWEDEKYQRCLDAADKEVDPKRRLEHLRAAEEILLQEMPVLPIYYEVQQFKRKPRLKVAVNTLTGHVDFSTATIEPGPTI